MHYLLSSSFFFFFNDTATTEIYTLSLHDALPIWARPSWPRRSSGSSSSRSSRWRRSRCSCRSSRRWAGSRSEEHTSELQSQSNLVCRLLLEKKKKKLSCAHAFIRDASSSFVTLEV